MNRPVKTLRLSYTTKDSKNTAYLQVLGNPPEVRMASGVDSFISVREDGLSLSSGIGNNINIQGMSQNLRYAGLLMDLPFPLSLIPTTPFTPFPKQVFNPPLAQIMPFLADLSIIASSLVV